MNLYPYQQAGVDFLMKHPRALLADRMGLGKTVQAVVAARKIGALRSLVVAPASTLPNWEVEWEEWDGPANVRFVSYSKLIREEWRGYAPDLTILDESHYCKNPEAQRTRAALTVASRSNFAWLLTGTPMPNDPTEAYPMFKWLWPDAMARLGIVSEDDWREYFTYSRYTEYGWKPYAVKNGSTLRAMLDNVMLRRSLDDAGLDLPPLRIDIHRFPQTDIPDLEPYDDLHEDDYMATVRRVLGVAKAPAVASLVAEELGRGEYGKIVLLYHHLDVGRALADHFDSIGLTWIGFSGSTPVEDRQRAVLAFQSEAQPQVFLAQQTAAGVGITLHAAREIALVEPAWSPTDNLQAVTRIHRIGQDHPCRARLFAVRGTFDENVIGTIHSKLRMLNTLGLEGEL